MKRDTPCFLGLWLSGIMSDTLCGKVKAPDDPNR